MMYVEWTREIATIVMLATLGIIAGKDNLSRFLYFLFSFALDIIYYIALKILRIGQPPCLRGIFCF